MRYAFLIVTLLSTVVSQKIMASIWDDNYKGPTWHSDYDKALSLADEKKRFVLTYFSGSDWCAACWKLDENVLSQPDFQAYIDSNFVLLNLDFPSVLPQPESIREKNEKLRKTFEIDAFPSFIILTESGEPVGKPFSGCGMLSCSEKKLLKQIKKRVQDLTI